LTSYEADEIKLLAENPFEAFIKGLCGKVVHIHVADTDGTYVPGKSSVTEGKSLGRGDLDLEGFAKALQEIEGHSTARGSTMIVLEPKETDFDKPLNTLASLVKLGGLIRRK
jgi:sugar phosphate isomerase/epimerase